MCLLLIVSHRNHDDHWRELTGHVDHPVSEGSFPVLGGLSSIQTVPMGQGHHEEWKDMGTEWAFHYPNHGCTWGMDGQVVVVVVAAT